MRPSGWAYSKGNAVIVDDLDVERVSVKQPQSDWFLDLFELDSSSKVLSDNIDSGLLYFGGFTGFDANNLVRQTVDSSYGMYRKTLIRSDVLKTGSEVSISLELPSVGKWRLDYHLPGNHYTNNWQLPLWRDHGIRLVKGEEWTNFNAQVVSSKTIKIIDIEGERLRPGWNDFGTFNLAEREVEVIFFMDGDYGTVVFDAIRWTPIESDELKF